MRKIAILTVGVLFIFSLLASGAAEAQKKKGEKDRGKRIKEMELVISDVGAATISYQYRRGGKGRIRTKFIGIADVTRIQKRNGAEWENITIQDLRKKDKVLVTLYIDPDDPYFPALSVRIRLRRHARRAQSQ